MMNRGVLAAAATAAAVTLVCVPGSAWAKSKRQLDAHEHGHGTLNMAIEGNAFHIELEAPGADIVGFEHAASSDEDKARLAAGTKTLKTPSVMFSLPVEAGCKVKSVEVDYETGGEHGHEKHGHDPREEHSHGDKHKHDHAKEETREGGHAEFHARYAFDCKNTAALTVIGFPYFTAFENARELSVTLVTDKGQKAFEVSREQNRIDLRGSM